jgi:glutamine amidotransferase-like uncharacterized protein
MDIPKGCIALFIHQPKCSVQSGNGIVHALSPHYRFKIFTRHDLEDDFFDDVDIVCVPGGIGDSESYKYLMKEHEQKIKRFVQRGGKYLGICMGAYWADRYYFDLLCDVRAEQYIIRPGTDTRRPHAKNQTVLWKGQEEKMFFYDGCAFTGAGLGVSDIWALYPNGDPMAIIQGRLGLIGCHPESEPHWYDNYSWMQGKYHNGEHHKLLLEFVDELMKA